MDNYSIKETTPKEARPRRLNPITDWFIRLIKGIVVGIGFILPGLSGGVLAVIVGMYDPLIKFLANLKDKFLKNIMFFLPFAIGAAVGIVLFAVVVEKAFGKYAAQFVCLFVGFVAGTFPSLFKTAGKQGRKNKDFLVLILSAVGIFTLMLAGGKQLTEVNPHILSWLASGLLMGLGLIVPGLSPSNFLIYFGIYDKMATGIKDFDFAVIIPLVIGFILCVILFSKIAAYLFSKSITQECIILFLVWLSDLHWQSFRQLSFQLSSPLNCLQPDLALPEHCFSVWCFLRRGPLLPIFSVNWKRNIRGRKYFKWRNLTNSKVTWRCLRPA